MRRPRATSLSSATASPRRRSAGHPSKRRLVERARSSSATSNRGTATTPRRCCSGCGSSGRRCCPSRSASPGRPSRAALVGSAQRSCSPSRGSLRSAAGALVSAGRLPRRGHARRSAAAGAWWWSVVVGVAPHRLVPPTDWEGAWSSSTTLHAQHQPWSPGRGCFRIRRPWPRRAPAPPRGRGFGS